MNLNLPFLFPEWIAIGILVILVLGEILRGRNGSLTAGAATSLVGTVLVFLAVLSLARFEQAAFGGMFILDPLSSFFKAFFALVTLVVIVMSHHFFTPQMQKGPEASDIGTYYLILWSVFIGLFFLVSANDFLTMFITLEIVTLSFYILASYLKRNLISIEAGLKYLILGSVASAFMIYGISLIYVAVGSTSLPDVRVAYGSDPENRLLMLGILFVIAGLGFKVASVPFQVWVPDVYEGAPTPVVAYLSVASKAAGFALLLRLMFTVFIPFDSARIVLFTVFAIMTLLYGNLGALLQTNIKRLFGYSSIGHAGYILMGIAVGEEIGTSAVLYYLMAYAVTNLAAFYVIAIVGREGASDTIEAYRGLGERSPFLAGTLLIALISLAGVPPLAGFFGKFLILLAAVKSGLGWLALIGALAVALSLYYYLNIIKVMYAEEPKESSPIQVSLASKTILVVLILGIFVIGIYQAPFLGFAKYAVMALF